MSEGLAPRKETIANQKPELAPFFDTIFHLHHFSHGS